jgi:hypothetical protein
VVATLDAAVDAAGVQERRRSIYSKDLLSQADLTGLLELGRRAGADAPREYGDLLADVATDLMVNQADPPKYVSAADANWLVAQIQAGGGLGLRAEFEMLLAVLRYAVSIPPALSSFAVGEIEKAIVQGHRAAQGGADHVAGIVTRDDVESLRNAVFAATEGASLHVTRESAEALFRIAHATSGAANDPAFDDLFAKAIGNYLMGIAFHWTPSVAEEAEREKWLDQPSPSFGGFLQGLLHIGKTDEQRLDETERGRVKTENDADDVEIANKSEISAAEGDWVLAHLTRGADLTPAEKKLLLFLKENARSLPAGLVKTIESQAQ